MPSLKKRHAALLIIALLVPALLLALPQLAGYLLVKFLADDLQLEAQIEDVDLNLFTGRATIRNLFITGEQQSNLEGAQLAADLDMSQLLRGELVAESIRLQGVRLHIVENQAGQPVALVPLVGKDAQDSGADSVEIPLFSLQELQLIDVQLLVDTLNIKGQFNIDELQLRGLSTSQSQPGLLRLKANWNETPLIIDGTIAPFHAAPWFEGDIQLRQVQLSELNPYLPEPMTGLAGTLSMHWQGRAGSDHIALQGDFQAANIALELAGLQVHGDTLSWQGNVSAAGLDQSPTFTVSGDVTGSGLGVTDEQRQLTLMQLEALALREVSLNEKAELLINHLAVTNLQALDRGEEDQRLLFGQDVQVQALDYHDDRLAVGAIRGENVVSTVRLTAEGELVSQGVLSASLETLRTGGDVDTEAEAAAESALQWRVDDITVRNSRVNFFDEKFEQPLHFKLAVDELTILGLDSSQPQQAADVSLKSGVGDFGRITLDGKFSALAPEANTQLKGTIKALPLPLVSPYVEQLLGYELVAGQFDHDFEIALSDAHIKASNELNLRKLKVKKMEGVTGEAPLPVPLGFALDMLRDKDDHIALSVPLDGQLDDPKFGLGQAISRALGKAMKSGSTLFLQLALQPYGAIWMGAEKGLKLAGQMRLDPMPFPALQSEMGVAQQDYAAKLALILTERPKVQLQLCGEAGAGDYSALTQSMAIPIEPRATAEAEATGSVTHSAEQQQQMTALADARARGLKHWLVREKGIDSSRLYLCKAKADPAGKINGVAMSL
jgi:hypothetical protein